MFISIYSYKDKLNIVKVSIIVSCLDVMIDCFKEKWNGHCVNCRFLLCKNCTSQHVVVCVQGIEIHLFLIRMWIGVLIFFDNVLKLTNFTVYCYHDSYLKCVIVYASHAHVCVILGHLWARQTVSSKLEWREFKTRRMQSAWVRIFGMPRAVLKTMTMAKCK